MLTLDQILNLTTFAELFPDGTKKEYRQLLKRTHPDLHPGEEEKAQKAFVHVTTIWQNKTTSPNPNATTPNQKPATPQNTVYTKRFEYVVSTTPYVVNGVAQYKAQTQTIKETLLLFVATNQAASKRMLEGTAFLKKVRDQADEKYLDFYPKTLDAFYQTINNEKRFSAVINMGEQEWFTLAQVKQQYPQGIAGEDYAWIARRVFVALGVAHDNNVALVAPTLNSFFIQPETHGLKLTEWQYATELGEPVTALPDPTLVKYYKTNKTSKIKTDLQIMAEQLNSLLSPTAPKQLRMFAKGMAIAPTSTARDALIEFEQLLTDVYGERKFHKFTMAR